MRAVLIALMLVAAGPLAAQVAAWSFDTDLEGWTPAGPGTAEIFTEQPLAGAGTLRMELNPEGRGLRLTSPEFPVEPWQLYRVTWEQRADVGATLGVEPQLKRGEDWVTVSLYRARGLFGTLPDSTVARLVLVLDVHGKAAGRTALVDDLTVEEAGPLVRERGQNLYWDGGFEQSAWDFTNWAFQPEVMERRTGQAAEGEYFLHVESSQHTYIVFPSVPVEPGRLYRFRCRVRGEGVLWGGMHKLDARGTQRLAYASMSPGEVRLNPDFWQVVEFLTPCESEEIGLFQVLFPFPGQWVDFDAAEMRSIAELKER